MLGYGFITKRGYPKQRISLAEWRKVRDRTPHLRRRYFIKRINPFTGESLTFDVRDSADVVIDDHEFGWLVWEGGRIRLDGDPLVLTPVALSLAAELDSIVEDEDGKQVTGPRSTLEVAVRKSRAQSKRDRPPGKTVRVLVHKALVPAKVTMMTFIALPDQKWSTYRKRLRVPDDEPTESFEQFERANHALPSGRPIDVVHRYTTVNGWTFEFRLAGDVVHSSMSRPPSPKNASKRNTKNASKRNTKRSRRK